MEWVSYLQTKFMNYISNEQLWRSIGESALQIIIILLITGVSVKIGKTIVRKFFDIRNKTPLKVSEKRQTTLLKLMENIVAYVIYFVAFIMVLEALTIDVRAILAGAGVVGLAVGFGAQNLVRDVITGFFIIFEGQFSVGDYIRTGIHEGEVEEIGLRTTKIKSWTGELHILPNGNINEVTNFSIHNSVSVVDVSIAYEENIPKAEQAIQDLLQELPERYPEMKKTPELLGVQNLGASEVLMRVTAEVEPMTHWKMARAIRKEIKLRLDKEGIEIPFPRLVIFNRNEESEGHINAEG